MPASRRLAVAVALALMASLALLRFAPAQKEPAQKEPAFTVRITSVVGEKTGSPLAKEHNWAFAGIEQTLVATVTPPADGVTFKWTVHKQAIRTYEHDVQDASKHKTIPLKEADLSGPKVSYFWTEPRDGLEVSVTATKGGKTATTSVKFDVRLPKDANRLVYSYDENDPRRSPNGPGGSYSITRDHRQWHGGQNLSGDRKPVYGELKDAGNKPVWGDVGYRTDPPRLFDLDYNGTALIGWHGAALDAHRAWRRTFHVPTTDAATPSGSMPVPGYLQRVPAVQSADTSRLYGYVRVGEYQNTDQLGRDLVHPWHNRSHTGIAKTNDETLMDNHGRSPPAKDDLFWRWHSVVEEVRRAFGPDKAGVAAAYPADGDTATDACAVYLAFDRKVSFDAPTANTVQLRPGLLTVNGKPAKELTDVGGGGMHATLFRLSGFPLPADGKVEVKLADTPGIAGGSWTFTLKKGAAETEMPAAFRAKATEAVTKAAAKQQKDDIDRLLALLKPADADDLYVSYLFRAYRLPDEVGVPILVKLFDHPSDQVKGRAIQILQYRYPGSETAAAAVPKLVALLKDAKREWWVRERAANALSVVGKPDEVVPELVASLESKGADEPVNVGSLEALGRLGPKAAKALPTVRKHLSDRHPQVQRTAYLALGTIMNPPARSPDELKALTVIDWKADDAGIATHRPLQQLGAKGAFAAPALLKTLEAKPPVYARAAVLETLGRVGGGADAAKVLLAALPARWGGPGDPLEEKFLSDRAAEALSVWPISDTGAVQPLADALAHTDPVVRFQAAKTLRRFGPDAKPAVAALVTALKDAKGENDPYEVGMYLSALRAVGPGAKDAGGELVKLLEVRSPLYTGREMFWVHFLRAYTLVTLADIGVPDAAKPHILDLLANSDARGAHGYAAAARAHRPEWTEGLAGLQRALKPDFPDFPMCFADFGMALGTEDSSCRLESLRALARMGPTAKAALPDITRLTTAPHDPISPGPPCREEAEKAVQAVQGVKADSTYPHTNVAKVFALDPKWPQKPADYSWGEFHGVAVNSKGEVFAFTRGSPPPVQVYDAATGKHLRSWGEKAGFKTPHSIRIDHEDNVWLGDIGTHTIQKFTPDGKLLLTLGTPGEAGTDRAHFNAPTDCVVTKEGDIFVTDGYVNARVVHFDKTGKYKNEWGKLGGKTGTKPGEFSVPHSVCVDSKGRLYVADRNNVRIQVFDQTGKLLDVWDDLIVPMSVCMTADDELWVCGSSPQHWRPEEKWLGSPPRDQLFMKFNTSGKLLQLFAPANALGANDLPDKQFKYHQISVDKNGNLYAADLPGKRVQKFVPVRVDRGDRGAVSPLPTFRLTQFDTGLKQCWSLLVEDVNRDGKKDLIVVAPTKVVWCEAPSWKTHTLVEEGTFKSNSMTLAAVDLVGDGQLQFALGGGWTPNPIDTKGGSSVAWLRRGKDVTTAWGCTPVADEPVVHRVRFADVFGEGKPRLVVAPMMGRDSTVGGNWLDGKPVRLLAYQLPADPARGRWAEPDVIDETFHVVHAVNPVARADGKGADLLVASYEGVHLLSHDHPAKKWTRTLLTAGNQETPKGSRGTSEVKPGVLKGGGKFLAAIEPWHGHQFVVYTPPAKPDTPWVRHVIDDQLKYGHAVCCADLNGDGTDEVIVGAMEHPTDKARGGGVRIYRATDAAGTSWERHVLDADEFAVEDLAAVDLTGSGRLDIVVVGKQSGAVRIYRNEGTK